MAKYKSDTCYSSKYLINRFKLCKVKKLKKRFIIFLVAFIVLAYLIFLYFQKIVNPVIMSFAEAEVQRMLTTNSNKAISQITNQYSYEDMIDIEYTSDGDISVISANISNINEISNKLAISTQSYIDENYSLGIKISIGTCSGLTFLAGRGSKVQLNLNSIGNVVCDFSSMFEESGINQTVHKLYVKIKTQSFLILPFASKKIEKTVDYLISECLIVGKIPNTYLNVTSLKDLL